MIKFQDIAHFYFGCFIRNEAGQVARLNEIYCYKPGHFPKKPVTTYGLVKADLSFEQIRPVLKPATSDPALAENIPAFIRKECEASVDLFGLLATNQAVSPDKIDLMQVSEESREDFKKHFGL